MIKAEEFREWILRNLALDAEIDPNGWRTNEDGQHYNINTKTGVINAGMGGKFNGKKARSKEYRQKVKVNLDHPDKIDSGMILQNRDRNKLASIQQIRNIAKNPHYLMMGTSHDLGSGSPVVSYGDIPYKQFGRKESVIDRDGKIYDMQYAVVDAKDLNASHDENGDVNEKYFSDDAGITRAIAGNGRIAAMQLAYKQGTADSYKEQLLADTSHGVDSEVLKGIENPVLVRVMQPSDVTPDIGDKTNTQSGMSMSQTERANNDRERIGDFSSMEFHDNGEPTRETLMAFISRQPVQEHGELLSRNGNPTIQALNRFNAAVIAKAYENDELTEKMTEAIDPDAKNILAGLQKAAGAVQKLSEVNPKYDVRPLIVQAASRAMGATQSGTKLHEAAQQRSLIDQTEDDDASSMILEMFAKNTRSPNAIAEKLRKMTEGLVSEAEPKEDMFGAVPQLPRNEIIKNALAQDAKIRIAMDFWKAKGAVLIRDLLSDSGAISEAGRAFLNELKAI